jgi:hypothetical protein
LDVIGDINVTGNYLINGSILSSKWLNNTVVSSPLIPILTSNDNNEYISSASDLYQSAGSGQTYYVFTQNSSQRAFSNNGPPWWIQIQMLTSHNIGQVSTKTWMCQLIFMNHMILKFKLDLMEPIGQLFILE